MLLNSLHRFRFRWLCVHDWERKELTFMVLNVPRNEKSFNLRSCDQGTTCVVIECCLGIKIINSRSCDIFVPSAFCHAKYDLKF